MRTRLRPGEELAAVVRRHVIVLGGPFALTLFLAGGLVGAWLVKRPYVLPAVGMALVLSASWATWRWLDWRSDLWGITAQRGSDESGALAPGAAVDDTKECPYCAETIKARANVCRFCGRLLR